MNKEPSRPQRLWRKARTPLLLAIREDVWGPAHRAILNDVARAMGRLAQIRKVSRDENVVELLETFDSIVRRKGYTEQQLRQELTSLLRVHWAMYGIAGLGLVYSFWLLLSVGAFAATVMFITSGAAAVQGYLSGYRAWQIRNRAVLTLGDAVRNLDTYLVI